MEEPERYQESRPVTPIGVLHLLRTYLSDALNKNTAKKRIAVRNKRFLLAFSDECDDIFEYLEFGLVLEPSGDGVSRFLQRMGRFGYRMFIFCVSCLGSEPACAGADQVTGNKR